MLSLSGSGNRRLASSSPPAEPSERIKTSRLCDLGQAPCRARHHWSLNARTLLRYDRLAMAHLLNLLSTSLTRCVDYELLWTLEREETATWIHRTGTRNSRKRADKIGRWMEEELEKSKDYIMYRPLGSGRIQNESQSYCPFSQGVPRPRGDFCAGRSSADAQPSGEAS